MSELDKFKDMAKTLVNDRLREHKQKGGKVIGTFCSYAPEELVIAAGMVPFRMRAVGSQKTTLGDAWFASTNCSYVRHLFDLALDKKFEFLDGIVFINACDHVRRTYDNWRRGVGSPAFIHMTAVPHKKSGDALKWFYDELALLRKAIEEHFQVSITDQALCEAIKSANQVRRLLEKIYELRKDERPPITGAECLSIIMAGTAMPRDQFARLLDEVLEELPGRNPYPEGAPRLLLASGCLEEIEHLELIEAQGAAVVDDSLCFGRRYFDTLVDESADDPLMALAERYMNHLSCPRMSDDFNSRLEHIKAAAVDYRLDGLICEKLKFCDLWGGESFILRRDAKAYGLPVLPLERELYGGGEGQIKTRVQAFLERIGKV